MPENLPTVRGEETYVEQALRNLLSNARKYGRSGAIVPLFELFYRSPGTADQASGVGIGLFVCRHLIEAMGGRIWAVPRPERGAEFGFALPRVPEDDA